MPRLIVLLITMLILSGCLEKGGGSKSSKHSDTTNSESSVSAPANVAIPPDTSPVTVTPTDPPPTSSPVHLLDVYLAQTHVLRPQDRFFRLVAQRDALFIARVENANQKLSIEVLDQSGGLLGSLALNGPQQLDKTANNGPAPLTLAHSVRIPGAWIHPGMQIRLLHGQQQLTLERPAVGAPNVLTFYSIPIFLFGKTLDSVPAKELTLSKKLQDEYSSMLPVSRFDYRPLPPMQLDKLTVKPTGMSPGEFLPAWPTCSPSEPLGSGCNGYRVITGVYEYLGLLMAANGDEEIADYYGRLVDDYLYGGVGGNSRSVGSTWEGLMQHEMGHAYGLGHAHEEFQVTFASEFNSYFPAGSKRFPYGASLPGDSSDNGNVGDTWGYNLTRREFISPYQYHPDGSIQRHKQDATALGGGMDAENGYTYSMFADSNVSRIQTHLEGFKATPGRAYYDADRLLRWNYDQSRYDEVPNPTPCNNPPLCSGPGDLPIERDAPVLTLFGSISRTSPELTQINSPYARTGNLIRLYDPTLPSDVQELHDQYSLYCAEAGCQYVLRLSEVVNGQLRQRHILLRAGFFAPFGWNTNTLRPGADDPNSVDSFTRWGVNIRPQGDLEKIEVLFKDHAENGLTPGEGDVVQSWSRP